MKHNDYKVNGINFIDKGDELFVEINQAGIDAFYPLKQLKTNDVIKYVLIDLDGTTVRSEEFWMYLIEKTTQELLDDKNFKLSEEDVPFVCGYTTVIHLKYVKNKYHFTQDLNTALAVYDRICHYELKEIMEGRGNVDAFKPRDGLKEFLNKLKEMGFKIGLATSGLDYKSIPEIVSAFRVLNMGDPLKFYDAIITGGRQNGKGEYGTIGELVAKPHPWVYRELAFGLKIDDLSDAIVVEDSASGLLAAKLAGLNVIGFKDGNLMKSGLYDQALFMVDTFDEVIDYLKDKKPL